MAQCWVTEQDYARYWRLTTVRRRMAMTGKVKRLIADKGFGFILGEDGKEYFFHSSALKNTQFKTLQEGDEVTFENAEGSKGPRAEDIFV